MAISNRLFSEALRDFNRAFSLINQPTFFEPALANTFGKQLLNNTRYPPTDVLETNQGYEIHAELPGVQKQDIDIQVPDDHTIVLKGEVKYAKTEESNDQQQISSSNDDIKQDQIDSSTQVASSTDNSSTAPTSVTNTNNTANAVTAASAVNTPHWWRSERMTGAFSRSFSFPQAINPDTIKALYKDGVLTVTIPKLEKSTVRIPIE
ncbi:unnamed protein product [Cunninghamella blakesleeana]